MSRRLVISDHALVRYLDRVGGFEVERLRMSMADRLQPFVGDLSGAVVVDGHAYVIEQTPRKGPVLVSVLPFGIRQRMLKGQG